MEKNNMIQTIEKREYSPPSDSRPYPISSMMTVAFKESHVHILNCIRRVMMEYIPTYAFDQSNIIIEKNTSIFNNDYMRLRLSQLVVPNQICDISYLLPEYINSNRKHPDDNQMIEYKINVTNKTSVIMNVTTDDIDMYVNNKKVNIYKTKMGAFLLIQLKPNETFVCTMKATLGNGETDVIWSPVSTVYYREPNVLLIKSHGQMDEYELLFKVCICVVMKLGETEKHLLDNPIDDSQTEIEYELQHNNFTLCNLINYHLQSKKEITFSGIVRPNHDHKIIIFKIQGKNIQQNFIESLYEIVDIFTELGKDLKIHGKEFLRKSLLQYL